jgi:hypothetical protein
MSAAAVTGARRCAYALRNDEVVVVVVVVDEERTAGMILALPRERSAVVKKRVEICIFLLS